MGEVKKEEEAKKKEKKEEKKKEGETKEESQKKEEEEKKKKKEAEEEEEQKKKKEEEAQEIVLKVDMHCEGCAKKVTSALKEFQGVEDVKADYKASKVVVKGKNADPAKVSQRIRKKSGKKVEIISPLPNPTPQNKEDENEIKQTPKEEDKKVEPPPVITVVLKVRMHCEACAQALQKRIRKVKGVESVTTDLANNQVTVKGVVNPEKLVSDLYKKTGKQASIVKGEEGEEKKKEDEKKEGDEKQKEAGEEKKESSEEGNKAGEEEDGKNNTSSEIKKSEYWGPKDYMGYEYASYSYPYQYFSDENPNACSVM